MKSIILLALLITGCSVEFSEEPKDLSCTDTRDGEEFVARNIRDPYVTFLDACYIADVNRKPRHLCKSHEAFLKCEQL